MQYCLPLSLHQHPSDILHHCTSHCPTHPTTTSRISYHFNTPYTSHPIYPTPLDSQISHVLHVLHFYSPTHPTPHTLTPPLPHNYTLPNSQTHPHTPTPIKIICVIPLFFSYVQFLDRSLIIPVQKVQRYSAVYKGAVDCWHYTVKTEQTHDDLLGDKESYTVPALNYNHF